MTENPTTLLFGFAPDRIETQSPSAEGEKAGEGFEHKVEVGFLLMVSIEKE